MIKKYSVRIAGHDTSVSLEPEFWRAFQAIARARNIPVNRLITKIDAPARKAGLSSAIRLFVLKYYQDSE